MRQLNAAWPLLYVKDGIWDRYGISGDNGRNEAEKHAVGREVRKHHVYLGGGEDAESNTYAIFEAEGQNKLDFVARARHGRFNKLDRDQHHEMLARMTPSQGLTSGSSMGFTADYVSLWSKEEVDRWYSDNQLSLMDKVEWLATMINAAKNGQMPGEMIFLDREDVRRLMCPTPLEHEVNLGMSVQYLLKSAAAGSTERSLRRGAAGSIFLGTIGLQVEARPEVGGVAGDFLSGEASGPSSAPEVKRRPQPAAPVPASMAQPAPKRMPRPPADDFTQEVVETLLDEISSRAIEEEDAEPADPGGRPWWPPCHVCGGKILSKCDYCGKSTCAKCKRAHELTCIDRFQALRTRETTHGLSHQEAERLWYKSLIYEIVRAHSPALATNVQRLIHEQDPVQVCQAFCTSFAKVALFFPHRPNEEEWNEQEAPFNVKEFRRQTDLFYRYHDEDQDLDRPNRPGFSVSARLMEVLQTYDIDFTGERPIAVTDGRLTASIESLIQWHKDIIGPNTNTTDAQLIERYQQLEDNCKETVIQVTESADTAGDYGTRERMIRNIVTLINAIRTRPPGDEAGIPMILESDSGHVPGRTISPCKDQIHTICFLLENKYSTL
jgi:hypothetical protein